MDGDCACGTGMTDLPVLFLGRRFKKLRIQMIDDSQERTAVHGLKSGLLEPECNGRTPPFGLSKTDG